MPHWKHSIRVQAIKNLTFSMAGSRLPLIQMTLTLIFFLKTAHLLGMIVKMNDFHSFADKLVSGFYAAIIAETFLLQNMIFKISVLEIGKVIG
jgi:hypothetical protein